MNCSSYSGRHFSWRISVPLSCFVVSLIISLLVGLAGNAFAESDSSTMRPGQVFRDCPDCPDMVVIPAGKFMMGMSEEEIKRNQQEEPLISRLLFGYAKASLPQHSATIRKSFALGQFPVMHSEFAVFARETGFSTDQPCLVRTMRNRISPSNAADWRHPGFEQTDQDPVVCVSWEEAQDYVAWLNAKVNGGKPNGKDGPYRLPSEAEWEYAARAGTQTVRWWGDDIGTNRAVCVGCGSPWDNRKPSPVGGTTFNPFRLSDMLGNIWEWTEDCWNKNYDQAPNNGGPWLSGICNERVMRGGSWLADFWHITSASRSENAIISHSNQIGFRVARTF